MLPSLSAEEAAKASTAITQEGLICSTTPFIISQVSIPVSPSTPVVMVATLPISRLRDFQIADYTVQVNNKEFKFTPPHFNYGNVEKKIRNEELWQM